MNGILYALASNLIVAALGGVAAVLFSTAKTRVIQLRQEREHPLSGDYLTEFEDEVDGRRFVAKAPATLTQRGLRVRGTTQIGGGKASDYPHSASWTLEGEIAEHKYLYGRYYAGNIRDAGVGNFFLEIRPSGEMVGMWSGYDSLNQKVTAGRYRLIPMVECSVDDITQTDVPAVLALAQKQLGDAYIDSDALLSSENVNLLPRCRFCEQIGHCVVMMVWIIDTTHGSWMSRGSWTSGGAWCMR